ncbi:GNAT family N-acetyltransferase [Jannaschia marina]|uniref:GNAT family N-acetyltransferase n=1 Tax=Jannaschia marina TaxID=2741674 RepID=UPI0015C9FC80|nr:GNAT family N-acetyltransferase [Jannaschia marina]
MIPIRTARPDDRDAILSVAETSGLFAPEEVPFLAETFDGWSPDASDDPRFWLLSEDGAAAAAVVPQPLSDNAWNLQFLAVARDRQRGGLGRAMLRAVEARLAEVQARLLLIDTASGSEQAAARALYAAEGYAQVGQVPGYYGPGIDRVTFARRL